MVRGLCYASVLAAVLGFSVSAYAQVETPPDPNEPDHIRGKITELDNGSMLVKTVGGETLRLAVSDNITVIKLSKGRWQTVDFGTYVGAVAVRLNKYSPIVRDSLSWLYDGFELRIVEESLRGIAVGHKKWDLTPESVIAHGWVDDMEGRVISIKYGPTEEEETDVEVGRDIPVLKMALGDNSMIKPDSHVFAGGQKDANGKYTAVFVFIGEDGVKPPL